MELLPALEASLTGHVSISNRRMIMDRVGRALRDAVMLTPAYRPLALATIRATLRLYTSDEQTAYILEGLEERLSQNMAPAAQAHQMFVLKNESDLRSARAGARDICLACGATSGEAQRIATAVSELSRNIIAYTPGGKIELKVRREPKLRITIVAEDSGAGIANLEQVLAGQYKSKTGLGRGLLGVKRLMQEFRVDTGPKGTRIEAEVTFS